MSSKTPTNRIDKATWNLVEGIKDVITANVMAASNSKQLGDVKLERLLAILTASVEEGYHRGNKVYLKVVAEALKDASAPPTQQPAKKKHA